MKLELKTEPRDAPCFEKARWTQAERSERATERPGCARTQSLGGHGQDDPVDISFVIPVRDAEATLIDLSQRVAAEQPRDNAFEVIFIDDGSRDRSWEVICVMARCEPAKVRGLRFANQAGQAAALSAGFRAARGAIIFTFGADLQSGPSEIRRFLDKVGEGYDLVSGRTKNRHDPRGKILPARIFNRLLSRISRVYSRADTCGLNCWRSEVAKSLMFPSEPHVTARALAATHGFRVAEIDVERHSRRLDVSNKGVKQSIRGFIDTVKVGFLKRHLEPSAHLFGEISAYQFASATTLLTGAVILAAMDSPTASCVAAVSSILLLGPALLESISGLLCEFSPRGGLKSESTALIVEDTEDIRKRRKKQASRRSASRSQAGA